MNILHFKDATEHFMKNNRVFRWHKSVLSNLSWWTLGSAGVGIGAMMMLGVHNIPHLPFEGKELNDTLFVWRTLVVVKITLGMMLALTPVALTGLIWDGMSRRALRKQGLNLLASRFDQILEKPSDDDKRAVMETALKLQGASHYKEIEDLQKCAQENLPKAWWMAVHAHMENLLHNETQNNANHPYRSEEQDRFSAACLQLSNRAHQVRSQTFKV